MSGNTELIKQIIKNTNVNFLLGAGCSYRVKKEEGKLNFPIMSDLRTFITGDDKIKEVIKMLDDSKRIENDQYDQVKKIFDNYLIPDGSNIEKFLSILEGADLYIFDDKFKGEVKKIQEYIKKLILDRIKNSDEDTVLDIFKNFYRGIIELMDVAYENKHSIKVFTTNYDMLNERALEELNIHYYSGFYGITKRKFNIAYYNYEYVDSFNVGKKELVVSCNHMNLYKLHGSISWCLKDGELYEKNPFEKEFLPEIIYPSVAKFEHTNLITYYSALMREFADSICKKDTTLVVSGTSMGDAHINKIIENALTIDSFTLILFMALPNEIEEMREKYKEMKNVHVYDESADFSVLADLLNNIKGE